MSELGAWLRAARVEAKLELTDLANKTKIQVRHLEAVEAGHWHALPTRVHARAFAMAMAKACGIEDDEAIAHVSAEWAPRVTPAHPAPSSAQLEKPSPGMVEPAKTESRPRPWRHYPWKLWSIVAVSAVLFLLLLNALVAALSGPKAKPQPAATVAPEALSGTAEAVSGTAAVEGEVLSLRSRRPTWVVLVIDGKRLPTILLERDKREFFRVKEKAVMLAGNIGAVRIWWRNDNLGYFGELGQRMNGIVFEPGQPWRKDPTQDLALPPGVPSKAAQ